jgi:hypothetical protein
MGKAVNGTNLGELSNKVYRLLQGASPEDRTKVLNSVVHLFGEAPARAGPANVQAPGGTPPAGTAASVSRQDSMTSKRFFSDKDPQNKGEMLAVAARYREQYDRATSHTAEDFAKLFSDARQNFDRRNFTRDMKNAQNQAHLFNKGTSRGLYQLSYFGQQYVDKLPDREAVKKLRRPKSVKRKQTAKTKAK